MSKITSVEPQMKSATRLTKRFNIFVDGKFAFGADEDLVVEYRLLTGKTIDKDLMEKLLFESEVGKLMERMYRLFNIRQRSEKEVRGYIRRLSFKRKIKNQEEVSEGAIELLVNKLKQKRLLSDEEFARAWVEARRKTKKKGNIALKAELYQKGISKDIIEEIFNQTTIDSEEQLAREALEKKLKRWKGLSKLDFKKKAYEFLLRHGFESEVIREIVEKTLQKE